VLKHELKGESLEAGVETGAAAVGRTDTVGSDSVANAGERRVEDIAFVVRI